MTNAGSQPPPPPPLKTRASPSQHHPIQTHDSMRYIPAILLIAAVCHALPLPHDPIPTLPIATLNSNSSLSKFDPNGAAAWAQATPRTHPPHPPLPLSHRQSHLVNSFYFLETSSSPHSRALSGLLERMLRLPVQPRHSARQAPPPLAPAPSLPPHVSFI